MAPGCPRGLRGLHAQLPQSTQAAPCTRLQGLPPNTTAYDDMRWARMSFLRVPLEKVQANFQSYSLLDEQVAFHVGFFRYSLPAWRAAAGPLTLAVLRLDGGVPGSYQGF